MCVQSAVKSVLLENRSLLATLERSLDPSVPTQQLCSTVVCLNLSQGVHEVLPQVNVLAWKVNRKRCVCVRG